MKAVIDNEERTSSFWEFKGQTDYVDTWFLMRSPYLPLCILGLYHLFVLKVGPDLMRGRRPMKLRKVLIAYNAFQVAMSVFLLHLGLGSMFRFGVFHRTCLFEQEELRQEMELVTFTSMFPIFHFTTNSHYQSSSILNVLVYILSGSYWYLLAKVTELLDTVFFVLRKKQNQVTFLHVYHHTFTMTISWLLVKYGKCDDLIFVGTLNSFVHIIMYGYYGLSVFPGIAKYLWWKKYLTKLQLIQFMLVLIQMPINSITSKCPPSKIVIFMVFLNGFIFIYLFSNFYVKAYVKSKKDKRDLAINKQGLNQQHLNSARKIPNGKIK